MAILQQLEQQYHFSYPLLYHQLYNDGMLEWGTAGPNWITQQYPVLRPKPPLLLFANEFELMTFADVESQLEEFSAPGYWMNISPDFRFIPFAQNGAGDWYCFFPGTQHGDDVPVVFLRHDANRATYKAKNLQDFIFRCMLEVVADIEEAEYGLLQEDHFREDLQNFLRTHQPYLSGAQQGTLTDVYSRPGTEKPLISEGGLHTLLQKVIYFEQMDQDFPYTRS